MKFIIEDPGSFIMRTGLACIRFELVALFNFSAIQGLLASSISHKTSVHPR